MEENNIRSDSSRSGGGRHDRQMGHSISGLSAPAPWDLEEGHAERQPQERPHFRELHDLQQDPQPQVRFADPFWSDNTPPDYEQQCSDYAAISCGCGCCIGPCCSPVRQSDWRRFFTSITAGVSVINIILFVICIVKTSIVLNDVTPYIIATVLLHFGAISYSSVIAYHEFWRFFTAMFLHTSVIHILANTWFAYRVMLPAEMRFKKKIIAITYLLSGVVASIFSVSFNDSKIVSAGASGALMGIFGLEIDELVCVWKNISPPIKFSRVMNIVMYLVITFLIGASAIGVDNYAHFGGLLAGIMCGGIFFTRSPIANAVAIALLVVVIFLPILVLYSTH